MFASMKGDVRAFTDPAAFACFPSCSTVDGRMLTMFSASAPDALSPSTLRIALNTVPTSPDTITVGVFDGDAGGLWDTSAGTSPSLEFRVYPDPLGDGSGEVTYAGSPTDSWNSAAMADNAWADRVISNDSRALSGGKYTYIFTVQAPGSATGSNNFKVRTSGTVGISPQAFTFMAAGLQAAERTIMGTPQFPTNYDGKWTFGWNLKQALPTDVLTAVTLWDGDFDFGNSDCTSMDSNDPDTLPGVFPPIVVTNAVSETATLGTTNTTCTPSGNPADDANLTAGQRNALRWRPSSPDLQVGNAGVAYRLVAPNGQSWANPNPSGNAEWEQFRVDTDNNAANSDYEAASLAYGVYRVQVEGLDSNQAATLYAPYRTLSIDPTGNPVEEDAFYTLQGTIWKDFNLSGTFNAGEGVPGVTVWINGGAKVAVTDANGFYSVRVPAGTHLVSVINPNFLSGSPLQYWKAISTDGGPDNDVNTENGVLPGAGGSLVTTVNFGYNNLAPTANDNSYVVGLNQPLTITAPGILDNDSDPDDAQSLLTTSIVTGAPGVVLNSNGSFTFAGSPTPGTVTFTYKVTDPLGLQSNVATVTILIKASVTAAATGGTYVYDGTARPGTCTITAEDSAPLVGVSTYTPGGSSQPVNVGTYDLSCDFAGDATHSSAHAAAVITITPKAATVTAGNGTKEYGSSDPALSAITTSGFDPADLPGIMLAQSRAAGESVGSYATTATATGGNLGNYTVTYVPGTFTITPKAAVVTAGSGTKVYGDIDPTLTTTSTGFTAGDVAGITLNTTRLAGEDVGDYATSATATGGNVGNYTVTYVPGNFAITPKAATVTAGGGTKVYGSADPALSAIVTTGFSGADLPGITLAQSRATGENVGAYATTATATGGKVGNYTVTYFPGNFTITPKAATVTAGNGTKEYGSSDPALTAITTTGFTAGDLAGLTLAQSRATGET
ncbi:MAG: cadherin-like domain-containing protein, partial [Acidobacteria bacterium]|nr:cadherin-like domain-containing protein [Acidobacteriota bacterium]